MDEVLEFVLAVKAAHREISRLFNDALRPLGVTAVQAEAILALADAAPLSVKELGARIVAESGNPTRLVDRLVTAGLVQRHARTGDRRQVEISLTDEGQELAGRIHEVRQPLLDRGRQALDSEELTAATAVMRQIADQAQSG